LKVSLYFCINNSLCLIQNQIVLAASALLVRVLQNRNVRKEELVQSVLNARVLLDQSVLNVLLRRDPTVPFVQVLTDPIVLHVEELRRDPTVPFVQVLTDPIVLHVEELRLDPTVPFVQVLLDQNVLLAQDRKDQSAVTVRLIPIALHAVREEVKVEEVAQDQQAVDVQTEQAEETKVVITRNVQNRKLQHVPSALQRPRRTLAVTIEERMFWAQDLNAQKRRRNLCATKMRRSRIVQTLVSV
jgi:hypothetical protein